MIIGNKKSILTYKGISENLDKAIDFILKLDSDAETGRYEIDGDNVSASVSSLFTKELDNVIFEAHKKYIDLHYILKGSEVMGYAPLDDCMPIDEYSEKNDCQFFDGEVNLITVNEGDFYIVYPFDAHAPGYGCRGSEHYTKVVVKIKV